MMWLHALASWWLVGIATTITLVHYPTFRDVSEHRFVPFHARHATGMGGVVALPWLIQGMTALWLIMGVHALSVKVVAASSAVAVGLTLGVIVPAHTRLARGFDEASFTRLTVTDRWRLAAFGLHALAITVVAYRYT